MPRKPRRIDAPPAAVVILIVVTLTAGLMLGATDAATRGRIEVLRRLEEEALMRETLGRPTELERLSASDEKGEFSWYAGRKEGRVVGRSYAVVVPGYGAEISAVVAITPEGVVRKVQILSHGETPGLGSKITGEDFLAQFEGKKATDPKLEIRKLGGDIDAATGATISSRAILTAVREAFEEEARRAKAMGNQSREGEEGGGG